MASRAASCLRISVFHRRFASGIYQTLHLWVVLFLPFVCICQSEWLRCGFESLHLCVSWLKWLIYDSLIRILFFFFLSHWYHILVFITAEINGFLIFGNWVCLFLSLVSYIPSFLFYFYILNYCWDQSLLESWHSYINILSLCVCESYAFYSVVSFLLCWNCD